MKTINTIRFSIIFMAFLVSQVLPAQNVAINTTGAAPDESAMLDIVNSSKGILLPRVSLVSTTDATTISNPAASLLVYNINASITGEYASGAGYYYNAGTTGSPLWRRLAGDGEVRWDDLRVVLDNGSNAAQLSYLFGSSGPQIWYFRNNQGTEAMSFNVQLPHAWKEGTTIYPHVHWTPKTSTTGNVEWNFEYTWVNYDPVTPQVFPAVTSDAVVATGPFTAYTNLITPLTTGNAGISGTGKKISSILVCRIWRNSDNPNDTYSADAGGLFVDFHIQVDSWGSRETYTK